jgi:hypothetical protein
MAGTYHLRANLPVRYRLRLVMCYAHNHQDDLFEDRHAEVEGNIAVVMVEVPTLCNTSDKGISKSGGNEWARDGDGNQAPSFSRLDVRSLCTELPEDRNDNDEDDSEDNDGGFALSVQDKI